jgi:hypothetical protein
VRLTPEIRGQAHKIGAVSPDLAMLGTLPEGFLVLRVVFSGCASFFLNCALLSGSTFVLH